MSLLQRRQNFARERLQLQQAHADIVKGWKQLAARYSEIDLSTRRDMRRGNSWERFACAAHLEHLRTTPAMLVDPQRRQRDPALGHDITLPQPEICPFSRTWYGPLHQAAQTMRYWEDVSDNDVNVEVIKGLLTDAQEALTAVEKMVDSLLLSGLGMMTAPLPLAEIVTSWNEMCDRIKNGMQFRQAANAAAARVVPATSSATQLSQTGPNRSWFNYDIPLPASISSSTRPSSTNPANGQGPSPGPYGGFQGHHDQQGWRPGPANWPSHPPQQQTPPPRRPSQTLNDYHSAWKGLSSHDSKHPFPSPSHDLAPLKNRNTTGVIVQQGTHIDDQAVIKANATNFFARELGLNTIVKQQGQGVSVEVEKRRNSQIELEEARHYLKSKECPKWHPDRITLRTGTEGLIDTSIASRPEMKAIWEAVDELKSECDKILRDGTFAAA